MEERNSQRFMRAFIGIEQELRSLVMPQRHLPFPHLVNLAAKRSRLVRDHETDLRQYADLRNAIVHELMDDEPIAEPHLKIVEHMEGILSLLRKPPRVADTFLGTVVTCRPDDLVVAAARRMYENSCSKLPVYDQEQFVGLLTAERVTHWFGHRFQEGGTDEPLQETVAAVLDYGEQRSECAFVARDCTVFRVLELFDEASHAGQRLQGVIVSEDGNCHGQPLGIITVFDLPEVYRILEG